MNTIIECADCAAERQKGAKIEVDRVVALS